MRKATRRCVTMAKAGLLCALLVFLVSGGAEADTFICRGTIFHDGDLQSALLATCGPPDSMALVGEETVGEDRDNDEDGEYSEVKVPVEEWLYNCGKLHFMSILVFKGGRLDSVRNGDRGTGDNPRDCR
jgi:hypothetical protein